MSKTLTIREEFEAREAATLSPHAALSSKSRGRRAKRVRRLFRLFEANRNCPIAPWIFQNVTSVGGQCHINAQPARRRHRFCWLWPKGVHILQPRFGTDGRHRGCLTTWQGH